jgi:RNA polymerase sigma factor (sigma-70 family)
VRAVALRSSSPERMCEALYRRHAKDVYRYTLGLLDRPADAEDATQTTFLNAYRALERGERPRNTRTWLNAIALNVCREYYRRARRRPNEVSLEEDLGELVLDPPALAIGDVIRGLRQLPFNQRAALVMREFEGRSLTEIAAELELSSSAVETLLFRARRSLREQLDGTLTCAEAEQAISRQLDGTLPRYERGPLRAHLRQCPECATLARRLRAQGSAIKSLAVIPIPATFELGRLPAGATAGATAGASAGASAPGGLLGLIAGGPVVGSVGAKLAIATLAGAAAVGVGYVSLSRKASRPADSPRLASTAERGFPRAGAIATPAGRGGPLRIPVTGAHTGRRGSLAGRKNGPAAGATTTSLRHSPTLPATANGHAYGHARGVRAQGSPSSRSGSADGAGGTSQGRSHPTHPAHPNRPIHPTHPVTPPTTSTGTTTTTTTTAPPAKHPKHSTGKGNSEHQ